MPSSIYINDNHSLWVSNAAKDWFCDIVALGSYKKGKDISIIFKEEPEIAGCYGISGLGINMECLFKYFDGKEGLVNHLDYCIENSSDICKNGQSEKSLEHICRWAQFVIRGGVVPGSINIYEELPK